MSITLYLYNPTAVHLHAILKGPTAESPFCLDGGKTVSAPNGTAGKKFLLSLFRSPWTGEWEPFEAQVIEAEDNHVYNIAPKGIPTEKEKDYGEKGGPVGEKKKDARDGSVRY